MNSGNFSKMLIRTSNLEGGFEEVPHALFHVLYALCSVPLTREKQQLIWLLGCNEGVDKACCVPKMHILIYETMDQQEIPSNSANMVHDRAPFVSFWITLWSSHIPLGVTCVIAIPMCHWRSGHRTFEHIRGFRKTHCTEVTTITPAHYANFFSISQATLGTPYYCCNLIVHFKRSTIMFDCPLKRKSSARTSSVVNLDNQAPTTAQELRSHVGGHHPRIAHELHVETPITRNYCWVWTGAKFFWIRLVKSCLKSGLAIR